MISPSQQQIYERWDSLSEELRGVLFSEQNDIILQRVCGDEHVSAEKIPAIAKSVGYVLLGFIHPEDLAKEISDRAGVASQTAQTISDSLNARLFAPLRSELDEMYAPVPHEEEKFVSDIRNLSANTSSSSIAASTPSQPAPKFIRVQPLEPAPMAPRTIEIQRMSSSMPLQSVAPNVPSRGRDLTPPRVTMLKPQAAPTSFQAPKPPVNPSERKISYESLEGLDRPTASPARPAPPHSPAIPVPTPAPRPSAPPPPAQKSVPGAAPFILHQESQFRPIQGFSVPKRDSSSKVFQGLKDSPQKLPPRPAEIQIGKTDAISRPTVGKTESAPLKVVHYSQWSDALTIPSAPAASPHIDPRQDQVIGHSSELNRPGERASMPGSRPISSPNLPVSSPQNSALSKPPIMPASKPKLPEPEPISSHFSGLQPPPRPTTKPIPTPPPPPQKKNDNLVDLSSLG